MSFFSVVILSRNPDNLVPCVRALRENEPGLPANRIIVVDDGARKKAEPELARKYIECEGRQVDVTTYGDHSGITWVTGKKPFCFAANSNVGFDAAAPNDVILLNDDALLETPYGFTGMWGMARNNPEYGLIGATCNNVGNTNQWQRKPLESGSQEHPENCECGTCGPGHRRVIFGHHDLSAGLREEPRMVCFVCVLIPRRTIETVGGLDEVFRYYGMDDDDYCLRVRKAGLKIGIWDGAYVDHGSLQSSYRGAAGAGGDYRPNLELFKQKWGVDNFGRPA